MKTFSTLLPLFLLFLFTGFTNSFQGFPDHPLYTEALEKAEETGKPLLLLFTGKKCKNPQQTNALLSGSPKVKNLIEEHFIFLQLFVDDPTPLPEEEQYVSPDNQQISTVGARNQDLERRRFEANWTPLWVVLDGTGEELQRADHLPTEDGLLEFLQKTIF